MLISDTGDTGSDLDVICNRNLRARDTSKWEVPSPASLITFIFIVINRGKTMKLTGERVRICKLTPNGHRAWDLPASGIRSIAHLKHLIQYDDRKGGRIYHVDGKLFRTWRDAVKAAVYGTSGH